MQKCIGWLLTPLYLFLFWSILGLFHILQLIGLAIGRRTHRVVLDLMNLCLVTNFRTMGTSITVEMEERPRPGQPIIIISNHQSMYDIPLIIWFLRHLVPQFIAKAELGRGIPSISLALRHMGSVLIERDNQRQALAAIEEFGQKMVEVGGTVCIFPEGTRARDGRMKRFKPAGLITLLKAMPQAQIVPVSIDGSWQLLRWNFMPVPAGVQLKLKVLRPIERTGLDDREIVSEAERRIAQALGQTLREEIVAASALDSKVASQ